jgi:hypothetical protein
MDVTYRFVSDLPVGVLAMVVEGDRGVLVAMDASAPQPELEDALSKLITRYANGAWLYVGDVRPRAPGPEARYYCAIGSDGSILE